MFGLLQIIFTLALVTIGLVLQVFLSRRTAKWPGLILPAIAVVMSLINLLNIHLDPQLSAGVAIGNYLLAFLTANIPTAILLVVYFACRKKHSQKTQLEKMNIQDL